MPIIPKKNQKTIFLKHTLSITLAILFLLWSQIVKAEITVTDNYVPVAELLGGASGLKINSDGELTFFNEKSYAVTAEVLLEDGSIKSFTLPPRSLGPIGTAVEILDKPLSTIGAYINGSFGQSEIIASNINPEKIQSITYIGGRKKAQQLNVILLATTAIQNAGKALSFSGKDKRLFDLVGDIVFKKISDEQFTNGIINKMSSGCGFLTTCKKYISNEIKRITLEVIEELATKAIYKGLLIKNGMSPAFASDFIKRKVPIVKTLDYLAILEDFGDWGVLLSGTIAFSNKTAVLRVQTVENTETETPVSGEGSTSQPTEPSPIDLISGIPSKNDVIDEDKGNTGDQNNTTTPTASNQWLGILTGMGRRNDGSRTYEDETLVWSGQEGSTKPVLSGNPPKLTGRSDSLLADGGDSIKIPNPPSSYYKRKVFTNLDDSADGTYKHTAWGKWNGELHVRDEQGQNATLRKGFWVVGNMTKSQTIKDRSEGNAEYNGSMIGDFNPDGTTDILRGVIFGDIKLVMNFKDKIFTGDLDLKINTDGTNRNWLKTTIKSGTIKPDFSNVLGAKIPFFYGDTENPGGGGVQGIFYGPTGEEIGGKWDAHRQQGGSRDGHARGVFRAKEKGK